MIQCRREGNSASPLDTDFAADGTAATIIGVGVNASALCLFDSGWRDFLDCRVRAGDCLSTGENPRRFEPYGGSVTGNQLRQGVESERG